MQCKSEANGKGEMDCLREGRKVTRCAGSVYVFPLISIVMRRECMVWRGAGSALSWRREGTQCAVRWDLIRVALTSLVFPRLEDVNKSCLEEFRKHWECLDNNNQQLWQCRKWERPLNSCVFEKLVCALPLHPF